MRDNIKLLAQYVSILTMAPLFVVFILLGAVISKDELFSSLSQLLSLIPGKTGSYLRVGFYRMAMKHCRPSVYIGFGTIFSHVDTIIEDNVYIGPQCNIGKSIIREGCLVGSGVHVVSGRHQHGFDDARVPIGDQKGIYRPIIIDRDCWIGNGAIVMENVGEGCVIGAGSIVVDSIDDYHVAAGNPARILRSRR